jgi:hypothetical protein
MGDRCWLQITILEKDRKKFEEELLKQMGPSWQGWDLFDDVYTDDKSGVTNASISEANNAWCDELDEVASKGVIFEGTHGEGGSYGASDFVSNGSEMYYCPTHEALGRVISAEGDRSDYDKFLVAEAEVQDHFKSGGRNGEES